MDGLTSSLGLEHGQAGAHPFVLHQCLLLLAVHTLFVFA